MQWFAPFQPTSIACVCNPETFRIPVVLIVQLQLLCSPNIHFKPEVLIFRVIPLESTLVEVLFLGIAIIQLETKKKARKQGTYNPYLRMSIFVPPNQHYAVEGRKQLND